jgi:kynureninase
VIRLAPSPLYNTFTECWDALQALKEISVSGAYEEFAANPALVT